MRFADPDYVYPAEATGLLARIPHIEQYLPVAEAEPVPQVGRSARATSAAPQPRRLTHAQHADIRLAADRGRSLRDLAAEYGVSHQTIANVLRKGTEPGSPLPNLAPLAAD